MDRKLAETDRAEAAAEAQRRALRESYEMQMRELTKKFAEAVDYLRRKGVPDLPVVRVVNISRSRDKLVIYPFTAIRLDGWILHEGELWRAWDQPAGVNSDRFRGMRPSDVVIHTSGRPDTELMLAPGRQCHVPEGVLARRMEWHEHTTYSEMTPKELLGWTEARLREHTERQLRH